MRLSRWGHSAYETEHDLAMEREALASLVGLVGPFEDAELIVVSSKTRVGTDNVGPSVRWVITTTSGFDHVDVAGLRARGIRTVRMPEARRDAVVETALAFLIMGMRRIGHLMEAARQGHWARADLPKLGMGMLRGRTIGVVGCGVIGAQMVQVLRALGAEVWAMDPVGVPGGVKPVRFEQMLRGAEAITIHCDLNDATRMMFDQKTLQSARKGMVIVNTARGGLMDVASAIELLGEGHLGGLGIDVFPEEPYASMSAVADIPGLWLTPHAAGFHSGLSASIREGLVEIVGAIVDAREPRHMI